MIMRIRVEFFGDEVDRITEIDVLTGEIKKGLEHYCSISGVSLCSVQWIRY